MGALVADRCFASQAEAVDYFYTSAPVFHTAGSTSYRAWYQKDVSTWKLYRQSISSTGAITKLNTSNAPVPVFASCEPETNYVDGMTIGWLIATAMIMAYSIKFLWQARP